MINTIFFGQSGRIGKLIINSNLLNGNLFFAKRDGQFISENRLIDQNELIKISENNQVQFVDLSIDYSSSENMIAHENLKNLFFKKLIDKSPLISYIGISSGAAQFPLYEIQDSFYREYARFKNENLVYLESLNIPIFYPQIFTLIGQCSFGKKDIGWVNVIEQARRNFVVNISDPLELRTWVSEKTLIKYLANFFIHPDKKIVSTIKDGEFCLADLVNIVENFYKIKCQIKIDKKEKWLPYAYVDQCKTSLLGNEKLEEVIKEILYLN
jgi:hypothetical protein